MRSTTPWSSGTASTITGVNIPAKVVDYVLEVGRR